MFFDTVQINTLGNLLGLFLPTSRIYVVYLLSALALALVSYWQVEQAHRKEHAAEGGPPLPGFWRYVFDPRAWTHKSAKQDFIYFAVNSLVYYGLISQFMISTHAMTGVFHSALITAFGVRETPLFDSAPMILIYTVAATLTLDFGVFITHWIMHKSPFLWHFHKVHHSAEVMNPMTLFRMHPIDLFITGLGVAFTTGLGLAGLFYMTNQPPQVLTIFGLNVIFFLFYLTGYNLRHSQIWLHYPAWLSAILISPAQHQIHHSSDPKHFDTNMGLIFSFWDKLFGTLYIPRGFERLTFGLSRKEPNPFNSIAEIYYKPFVWASETLRASIQDQSRRNVVYCGFGALIAVYGSVFMLTSVKQAEFHGPNIENMTWLDVHEAVNRDGFDSIIIPTGGTEQNGPFVTLGKHNFIIRQTAEQIARSVGKTLVAPVLAYVPEGGIAPATGHMKYAGTLSLPEPVFEAVLEASARSLKVHGFRNIFILGESGDSQSAQDRVVQRLATEWAGSDMRIANVGDYYFGNKQIDTLVADGYSRKDIGTHAGIRDTSELMAVSPENVRFKEFTVPDGSDVGANGDPFAASAAIGNKLLDLKISAASQQMRELLLSWGRKPGELTMITNDVSWLDRLTAAAE
jgi:sterol desaturase/sphingolipid hydroxylase (fatty acid hydroxylase superfamily)/creatinine amidohydrolase/Fe(II)-dependent formamide hydrolase-like protein